MTSIDMNAFRASPSHGDAHIGSRQLMVLVICIVASIASGVGAFTFLSATHPAPNRLSWSLEPPKGHAIASRVPAPANLQAARTQQWRVRDL